MRNLITDVAGLRVGSAQDAALGSGVTALIFDAPATASISISGGGPGLRDAALLEPDMTVQQIDALVLSGGSAFGLDSAGGVQGFLRENGRGLLVADQLVPLAPGAILFDLANGGDKSWKARRPIGVSAMRRRKRRRSISPSAAMAPASARLWSISRAASARPAPSPARDLSSARWWRSMRSDRRPLATAAISGRRPMSATPNMAASAGPRQFLKSALALRMKGVAPQNTTIAIVATDADLTKAQAKRLAIMAQSGMSRALRPAHAAHDGDVVFGAATGLAGRTADIYTLTDLGAAAADCLARAIARAVFEATPLPFSGALPSWRMKFGA